MKVQKMCQKTVRLSHLVAAMVAACAVFSASGAATTYVVPEGTPGNTPTAPYDSWATAANDPRVAADATDADGTIYILGGTYPAANRIAPEANVHVKIMATQSTAGTYGEIVISNVLTGYTTMSTTPGNRTFQIEGGTIKTKAPTASGNVFTEYVTSGAGWGKRHYARLVLTGGQTKLDTTLASATYVGFSSKNCEMVVKDGAKLRTQNCYVCRQAPSCTDFNFLLANGASVECSSVFTFARPASGPDVMTNCLLSVSNATLATTANNSSLSVGSPSFSRSIRMIVAGERPLVHAYNKFIVDGEDTTLVLDVAEAPLGGYAQSTIGSSTTRAAIYSRSNCEIADSVEFRLEGVAELSARLLEESSPPLSASWTLIEAGAGSQTIGDDRILSINHKLVADGFENFWLEKGSNGRALYLKYEYKVPVVYVVPEGTTGNTPVFPYNSWALAANSVKTGAQAVAVGGTMVIASGSYEPNPGSGLLWNCFPDRRAVLRAVASESDPSPGRVTLARNGFGSGYLNSDPDRFNVTLAYGTFTFATNASKQCFLEYTENNSWNVDNRCRLTVSGSQTVLDNSGAEFYVGMTCYNTTLHVTDHARSQAWRVYAGGVNGRGAKILIDSSAALTTSGNFYLANGAKDITVTVSNATLQADSVAVYPSSMSSNIWLNVVNHGVLSLTGTAKTFSPFTALTAASGVVFDNSTFDQPDVAFNFTTGTNNTLIVRDGADVNVKSLTMGASGQETGFVCLVDNAALAMPNACTLNGDAKLRLDVSKAAFNGTAPTFVSAGTLTVGSDASVELTGVAELKARAEAADVRRCKVTLLNAANGLGISDAAVQTMSESLPEGTVLQRTSTALKLRIGPPQGVVLSFR